MIRTLIVEDVPAIAMQLHELLRRNFTDIGVLEICDTVDGALDAIRRHRPELIFMDVELTQGESAFDILRKLAAIDFKIIFTTAYNQYAIQAIRFSALDFLLKPIDEDELRTAVQRFVADRTATTLTQREVLLSYQAGNQNTRLGLPVTDGLLFVQVCDILYCEGQSSQTSIHMLDKKEHVVSRTLKECEEMLERFDFCRVHKSYLVNLRHVVKYHKGDGGYVVLTGGGHADVSKSYKTVLLDRLTKL